MAEFIARNFGNKEFEIIIKTDSKEHYKATEEFARRLIDHAKPPTNADRIRKMTDEELAELFAGMCQSNVDGETHCYACLLNAWCPGCGYKDEWLEWLQQPYKENEDE